MGSRFSRRLDNAVTLSVRGIPSSVSCSRILSASASALSFGFGCEGVVYGTGVPWVDEPMEELTGYLSPIPTNGQFFDATS